MWEAHLACHFWGIALRGPTRPPPSRAPREAAQALQEELERTSPPLDPRLDQAEALLSDFARFWQTEPSPAERRKLLASLFDRIWQDSGVIVAVKPRPPFVRYFKSAERLNRQRKHRRGDKDGSDGTRTRDLRRDRPAL